MIDDHETPGSLESGGFWSPRSWLLGLALFLIYTANHRSIGSGDTVPATLLPIALVRGDGPYLDRFDRILRTPDGRLPGYATTSRGHSVSRYPVGAGFLAVPFVWPQVAALDWSEPGWERDARRASLHAERMGKNAAAAIAALAMVALLHLLLGLGLGKVALPTVLVVALGSDLWTVASQGLWQHGPAALGLTLAMLLLLNPTRPRLALAGLATAWMVVSRPIDLIFAATIGLWVVGHCPRRGRIAFFGPAGLVAAALIGYNLWFFDVPSGGYAQIEAMHPWAHGTRGTWTAPWLEGAVGTLLSPSHGLLVYTPWIALALATLPIASPKGDRRWSLARWIFCGLVPYFVALAKYSCWWGGHSFGPRFWIDALPLFAIMLGLGLDWSRSRCRPILWAHAVAITFAVGVQIVGASCYPSSWYGSPNNADRHHERLWDWRDTELSRCLSEGVRPRAW